MVDDPRKRKSEDFYFEDKRSYNTDTSAPSHSISGRLVSSKMVVALVSTMAVTVVLFLYMITNDLNQRLARSDAMLAELQARTDIVLKEKAELEEFIASQASASDLTKAQMEQYEERAAALQAQIDSLSEELRKALAASPDSGEVLEIDRQVGEGREELGRLSNSLFQVGLVFKGIEADMQATFENSFFLEMGFQKRGVLSVSSSPRWLAKRSTVFYYDQSVRSKANEVADLIENLVGARPDVTIGAGTGVQSNDRKNTINIHVIGN